MGMYHRLIGGRRNREERECLGLVSEGEKVSVTHLYEGPGWAPFNGPVCFLPYFNDMAQAIFDGFRPNYFSVIAV